MQEWDRTNVPTHEEVWLAQEDFWVRREMLFMIREAIDAVARHFQGFFIGRFDLRYSDVEAFRAGRGFAVVELNGVTGESTNLYDPSWSLWAAYRTLFRQWALLYAIGAANRRRGARPTGALALLRLVWAAYRGPRAEALAD